MFFTPFAFVKQPYITIGGSTTYTLLGYYIGGDFNSYFNSKNPYFRVLDSSGSISSSFIQGAGFNSNVNTVVTQSNGKIIVGGFFTTYSGSGATRIARINTDGTADTGSTWNTGTGFNDAPYGTVVQSNGNIIVGGNFTTYSGSGATRIARINTDGTADTGSTWNTGTGSNALIAAAALQTDEKVVIAGNFTIYSGSLKNRITRLNTDGTIDTGFNYTTGLNNSVTGIAIEPSGKIIAVGNFTTYSGTTANRIVRINRDGTIDSTFKGGNGFVLFSIPYSVSVQPDRKIIVQGLFSIYSGSIANGIVRLDSSGSIDRTYNSQLSLNSVSTEATSLTLGNGSTIVGGNFTGDKLGYVAFLDATGSTTERSAVSTYGLDSSVYALASQPSGIVMGVGNLSSFSGSAIRLFGLSSSGVPAPTSQFNPGAGPSSITYTATVQPDGKTIIGGFFGTYSGSVSSGVARINTNGTKDTTFSVGAGAAGIVYCSAIQSDGKILIGGTITSYSGSTKGTLVRINTDGSADTGSSWNPGVGTGTGVTIFSVAVQSDQKILIGGTFASWAGNAAGKIARINTNGSYDSTFKMGNTGFNNSVDTLVVQSDQKILAGGQFTTYSGSTKNYIVRINTNGSADTGSSWNQGSGFNSSVRNIQVQLDGSGSIIVGGSFTTYSGSTANRIARLNTNGTLDTTFIPTGSGFNSTVQTILPIYSSSITL